MSTSKRWKVFSAVRCSVTSWREFAYDFEMGGSVALEQIAALTDPESGLTGSAGLSGFA